MASFTEDWSTKKKTIVGSVAGAVALLALVLGAFFAWQNRPVHMPTSVDEAIATINAGRVDTLPADRREQYYAQTARLVRELPDEELDELIENEEFQEAVSKVREGGMARRARQVARGEEPEPWTRRPRRPQNENSDNEREEMTREQRQRQFRDRMRSMLTEMFETGNAQDSGLISEMFKTRRRGG